MNYGFIGCGNMAQGIIKGMLKNNLTNSENIFIYDIDENLKNNFATEYNLTPCNSNEDLINTCKIIILAIKPNIFEDLLQRLERIFSKNNNLIISIAAGHSINTIKDFLNNKNLEIIRVMPNINATIMESISGISVSTNTTEENSNIAKNIFSSVGQVIFIPENMFPAFSGIAGCSPAFTFLFIESLGKAGQKEGFNKKDSIRIAAQSVLGSAKLILENENLHPWELIDKVCSPGGTTIEGILSLEENNFSSSIIKAVEATIEKDKKL